jgi:superfamily II DNA helicase RecQ
VQEIGRAGRDNRDATATLYYNSSDIASNVIAMQDELKNYCTTMTCKRQFLAEYFLYLIDPMQVLHNCCSSCCGQCSCTQCIAEM